MARIPINVQNFNITRFGEEFHPEVDEWVLYQERLENFFNACSKVDDKKKKILLLNSIGANVYKLLRDLATPELPTDKEYGELCKTLNNFYTKPTTIWVERKTFYDAARLESESVTEFIAKIKRLASNCKFGVHLESKLLDKFIVSHSGYSRAYDRLCEEDDEGKLTLQKALDIVVKYQTKITTVNIVNRQGSNRYQGNKPNPNNKNVSNPTKPTPNTNKQLVNQPCQNTSANLRCEHCNYKNHMSKDCRYKTVTCVKCNKMGHIATVCKVKKINYISKDSNLSNCLSNEYIYNVNIVSDNNSIFLNVEIENKNFKFLLDSGAGVSLIPFNLYKEEILNYNQRM